jgi:hypothetical protein
VYSNNDQLGCEPCCSLPFYDFTYMYLLLVLSLSCSCMCWGPCCADAPESLLHGPEPAKRWLQQNLAAPLKRAAAARSGSASSSSLCAAAGYCHKSLLLYGPSGCGKTELVHALARDMGANLLYIPAGGCSTLFSCVSGLVWLVTTATAARDRLMLCMISGACKFRSCC